MYTYIYVWVCIYIEIPPEHPVWRHQCSGWEQTANLALWYAQVWLIHFNPCEGLKVTQPLPQMLFSCSASNCTSFEHWQSNTLESVCGAFRRTRSARTGSNQMCDLWLHFQTANSWHFFRLSQALHWYNIKPAVYMSEKTLQLLQTEI